MEGDDALGTGLASRPRPHHRLHRSFPQTPFGESAGIVVHVRRGRADDAKSAIGVSEGEGDHARDHRMARDVAKLDEGRDPIAALVVEGGGRLVGEDDPRPVDHRPGEGDPLACPCERVEGRARPSSATPRSSSTSRQRARSSGSPASRRARRTLSNTLSVSRRGKVWSSSPTDRPRKRSRADAERRGPRDPARPPGWTPRGARPIPRGGAAGCSCRSRTGRRRGSARRPRPARTARRAPAGPRTRASALRLRPSAPCPPAGCKPRPPYRGRLAHPAVPAAITSSPAVRTAPPPNAVRGGATTLA